MLWLEVGGVPRASCKFSGAPSRESELGGSSTLPSASPAPRPISLHYLSHDWASSHGCLGANGSVTYQAGGSVIRVQPVISQAWSLSPGGEVSSLRKHGGLGLVSMVCDSALPFRI